MVYQLNFTPTVSSVNNYNATMTMNCSPNKFWFFLLRFAQPHNTVSDRRLKGTKRNILSFQGVHRAHRYIVVNEKLLLL